MSDVVFRKSKRIYLRPLERADIPTLRYWINDPEVSQFLARATPVMEKSEEEWLDKLAKSDTDYVFGIAFIDTDELIGVIGLHQVKWQQRTATTGAFIGEKEFWGKGLGTEAKMLLLDFAFNTLDLFAIMSAAMAHNSRSIEYSKKCGYEVVGRIPRWIRRQDGERVDEVILVVYQSTWRPLWKKFQKSLRA